MNNQQIKSTYITRGITSYRISTDLVQTHSPVAGDVGIFEVISLGKHKRLQADDRRLRYIYPGDRILAAFGDRYASAQFEGYVPKGPQEEYHILGAGGAIGLVESAHAKFLQAGPTRLRLVGYATDKQGMGQVINAKYFVNPIPTVRDQSSNRKPITLLSVGSSMDSGKTTSAAFLAKGLTAANKRVAFIKLTGTVYSKDADLVEDCGAIFSTDFSHFGYPSTYMCELEELLLLFESLMAIAMKHQPDVVVIEIADGLIQRETRALLTSSHFMNQIDDVFFSCGDSLGAAGGLNLLQSMGITPFALGGLFTASPLMIKEVCSLSVLPILTLTDLAAPSVELMIDAFEPVETVSFNSMIKFKNLPFKALSA